jgi:hypothetical protein
MLSGIRLARSATYAAELFRGRGRPPNHVVRLPLALKIDLDSRAKFALPPDRNGDQGHEQDRDLEQVTDRRADAAANDPEDE